MRKLCVNSSTTSLFPLQFMYYKCNRILRFVSFLVCKMNGRMFGSKYFVTGDNIHSKKTNKWHAPSYKCDITHLLLVPVE